MQDLKFNLDENNQFVVRAIGLLKNGDKVLVQGRKGKEGYGFPGGSVSFLEASESTIVREFEEEIGSKVKVNKLDFIVENLFEFDGRKVHQISFYYELEFKDENDKYKNIDEFDGIEVGKNLVFKWVDVNDKEEIVKPKYIFDMLKELKDGEIKHFFIDEL